MNHSGLHKQAQKSFWYISGIFVSVMIMTGTALSYVAYALYTNSHPLLNKIEESCGCEVMVSGISETSMIIFLLGVVGVILLSFLLYIFYKAFSLHFRTRAFVGDLMASKKAIPSPIIQGLADTLDLTDRISEIRSDQPFVFTYGLIEPRIIISSVIVEKLSIDELRAILEHEREHLKSYDPLKIYISKIATESLFFIPGIHALVDQYELLSEISADKAATSGLQTKREVAQALYKVLGIQKRRNKKSDLAISSFTKEEKMGERVQALSDSSYSPRYTIPSFKTVSVVVGLGVLLLTFVINLPESQAQTLGEGTSQCIEQVAVTSSACRVLQEELCEQNYSSLQSQLCNKIF